MIVIICEFSSELLSNLPIIVKIVRILSHYLMRENIFFIIENALRIW